MGDLLDSSRIPLLLLPDSPRLRRARALRLPWGLWWWISRWFECWLRLWRRLSFTMQAQLQTQWCWAACSVSVSGFYSSASTWTQCAVVDAELGQTTCCRDGGTTQCNQPWFLDRALTRTGNLASWAGGTATMAQVRSEIRRGRPVCARIGWSGGGGHFVAIAGYRCGGEEMLDIRDPITGASDVALTTFTSSYQGTGSWTHTYWTEA